MLENNLLKSNFLGRDGFRWWIGQIASEDAQGDQINEIGTAWGNRVKVRIMGYHPQNTVELPDEDLPWAQVNIPVTEDGSSGLGGNSRLKNRAQVFGIFLDGKDSQLPLVLGSIPKIETLRNDVSEPSGEFNLNLDGNTNIEKAFNFFISPIGGSFTPQQACGMIGNFCVESGATTNGGDINPLARSGFQDENSFGIAQWNPAKAAGERFKQLVQYSSRIGLNYNTIEAQLRFVKFELETQAFLGLGQLRNTETVEEATIVFQDKYERPNKALAHTKQRIAFAQETFNKLGIGSTEEDAI